MVFNITFNNISVILWQSVLLVEKTTDLPQVTLSHNVVQSTQNFSGDCKSNYHIITMVPTTQKTQN